MAKLYKELTDEELKAEIVKLKAITASDDGKSLNWQGFHEVLKIYQEELELRRKLSQ